MTDPAVTLRLQAEASGVEPGVQQARASVAKLGDTAVDSGRRGSSGINSIGTAAADADRDVKKLDASASGLARTMVGLGALAVGRRLASEFTGAADRAGQLEARIRLATRGQSEFNYTFERSQSIARASYQSINQVAEIAIRSAGPMRQLGFGVRETLDLTEALSLSLVISAANQQKSANATDQFSKAMQKGVLRGQEFNTIIETAPRFADALEQALGKTRAELIAMAESGQLTVAQLAKVSSQLGILREETESMPTTVEDAKVRFGDAWQKMASDVNKAVDATGSAVAVIDAVADNLGNLATAAGVVAVAVGGRMVSAILISAQAKVAAIVQTRRLAQEELTAARAAQADAAARVARARAGMGAAGSLAAAEAQLAAATARTTAATQASSLALQAKAVAARAAGAAMALFGGPVGLAVTALTLFVLWARNSSEEARRLKEEVTTGFQGAIQTMQGFNRETANEAFAGLGESNKKIEQTIALVESLERQERQLAADRMRQEGRMGEASASLRARQAEVAEELDRARIKYNQLSGEMDRVIQVGTDLVLESMNVANATDAQRASTEALLRDLTSEGQTLDQNIPRLKKHAEETYGLEAANRLAAASFRELKQAATIDWTDIDKGLNQQMQNALNRNIELTQGKAAAMRAAFEQTLKEEGADQASAAEIEQRRAIMEQTIKLVEENDRLTKSQRAGVSASKDVTKSLDQQRESQRRYTEEVERLEAQLAGPIKLAEVEHAQRIAEINRELKAKNITQDAANRLQGVYETQLAKTTSELIKQQNAPSALLDAMTGELRLLGMLGEEREVHTRMLRAEDDMRRAIADSIEAGNTALRDAPDEQSRLIRQARAMAAYSIEVERNAMHLEDWAMLATNSVADVAGAFADLFSGQIRGAKDFFGQLKDVFKRGFGDLIRTVLHQQFIEPFQRTIMGILNGQGFAAAGTSNIAGLLAKGLPTVAGLAQGAGWAGGYQQTGGITGQAGYGVLANTQQGGIAQWLAQGKLLGLSMPALGIGAAAGLGTFSSSGSALGGLAGGVGGYAGYGAFTAGMAAIKAGGGLMAGLKAGWGALTSNPIGLAALAALAVDKISGGKLFGTGYSADSSAAEFSIGAGGASGFTSSTEVRQRSLFRGRQWRTTTSALDADAQASINELFDTIASTVATAAAELGVTAPSLVAGSFRQEFDKNGNLTREFGTIAGRVYNEAQEAFTQRLLGENLLAVAKAAGSAAEIERIAQGYRASAAGLNEVATFLLAVQGDITKGAQLWRAAGDGVLTDITALFERLNRAGETLVQTYERVTSAAMAYGDHIADIDTQLRRAGLNQWQHQALDIELAYREQIRTANELAKALGLSGARSEDLAKIEQLRAVNMASLQRQIEAERDRTLEDLSLSQYSPLKDNQKLAEAMQQLQTAVATGDVNRARSLSETALGLGRNLYASGRDYNSVYSQVTGLLESMGSGSLQLNMDDGTTMGDLADSIDALPRNIASELFSVLYNPVVAPVPPATVPGAPTGPAQGGAGGGGSPAVEEKLDVMIQLLSESLGVSRDSLQRTVEARLEGMQVL